MVIWKSNLKEINICQLPFELMFSLVHYSIHFNSYNFNMVKLQKQI